MKKDKKVSKKDLREARKPKFPVQTQKTEVPSTKSTPVVTENSTEKSSSSKKYSRAKAAGLKSTFTLSDNTLLMTSFGKGNDAIREYHVIDGDIQPIQTEHVFTTQRQESGLRFDIAGRIVNDAVADNPLYTPEQVENKVTREKGTDLIHIRKPLEKRIFGQNFEDNIHVQLAYSILDIDKILAVHVNNVVYELNNMLRSDGNVFDDDLISNLSLSKTYETFMDPEGTIRDPRPMQAAQHYRDLFVRLMQQPQLEYFGTILRDEDSVKLAAGKQKGEAAKALKDAKRETLRKAAYYKLCLLGMMRQATAHKAGTEMYTLDPAFDSAKKSDVARQTARQVLDRLFTSRVDDLNRDFLKHAKVNLAILFDAFNAVTAEDKKKIVCDYYDFVVRKSYKNQGFSVKHLREIIFSQYAVQTADHKYDTVRTKLNAFTDFTIFEYYQEHTRQSGRIVESLRASLSDEEKERVYQAEAEKLWPQIKRTVMEHILPKMDGQLIHELKEGSGDPDVTPSMIQSVRLDTTAHEFSKLIYLLTNFLDGKEINDLLTTLIHQFENIAGFIDVMDKEQIPCNFVSEYSMFADSQAIANELRAINSFARMAKESPHAKTAMFVEAAKVLGYRGNDEELERYIDGILDKNGTWYKSHKGFRNFIANNVVESDRFKYLVRYGNVAKLRELGRNTKVLRFVLKDIPDAQIVRYYNSCKLSNEEYHDKMRSWLADSLYSLNITDFEDVQQSASVNEEKERMKSLIRLYLTVLYLLTKNLVYVNSRYFLAFHCVERDADLSDVATYTRNGGRFDTRHYSQFAKDFITTYRTANRVTKYLNDNFRNSDDWMISQFRNSVEHLNTVRDASRYIGDIKQIDSYFGLYHYLMQRTLKDQYLFFCGKTGKNGEVIISEDTINAKMLTYFALVERYGTYCKDMVKALNVAFAYNLPRYKNLSIEDLFDRNNYLPKKSKDAMALEDPS